MGEILGGIQRGLGAALNAIYEVIPSYALAIVLLTVVVRALLVPLTVKQIKSMQAMQKLAPEQKKVQAKYRELQKKAGSRAEVQQIRMQMNQEVQQLFREHGVNPLGGCLPMLGQFPIYIGMFSIMRAAIMAVPAIALTLGTALPTGPSGTKTNIPPDTYDEKELRSTVCVPAKEAPGVQGPPPTEIDCRTPANGNTEQKRFQVGEFEFAKTGEALENDGAWISTCRPGLGKDKKFLTFACGSAVGTGHLPKDGRLFRDLTLDQAELIPRMHSGCTAAQAGSKVRILECSRSSDDGGSGRSIPYYLLIAAIIGTQYYQAKQMLRKATGQAAETQRMMMRFMPIFIGFISFNIPAGANLYFLVSNIWTIGQQHILLVRREAAEHAFEVPENGNGDGGILGRLMRKAPAVPERPAKPSAPAPAATARTPHPRSKKKRKRKKKR